MKRHLALLALALFTALVSCEPSKDTANPETDTPAAGTTETATATTATAAEATAPAVPTPAANPKVLLKTNQGDITLELNAEKAPLTVANFLSYVNKKHYDGTVFHRVIDGFMIQGGGFALEGDKLVEKATGKGVKNESANGLKNDRGTIAMARTNDPDSATAQFFINVSKNDMLNHPSMGGYTVFGKVTKGMDVVDKIKGTPTGTSKLTMLHPSTGAEMEMPSKDVPAAKMVILSATVVK